MELAEHLGAILDGFSELVSQHLKLARVELKEDATELGGHAAKIGGFVVFVAVGYGLLCVAIALFLRRWVPTDVAFLIVAALNLGAGAVGIALAVQKLKGRAVMKGSRDELHTTALALRGQSNEVNR